MDQGCHGQVGEYAEDGFREESDLHLDRGEVLDVLKEEGHDSFEGVESTPSQKDGKAD